MISAAGSYIFHDFENQVFVLLRRESGFIKSIGEKNPLLQPLLVYLEKVKQSNQDGDPAIFYLLQRYLLIVNTHDIKEKNTEDFIQRLSEIYYEAAESLKNLTASNQNLIELIPTDNYSPSLSITARNLKASSKIPNKLADCIAQLKSGLSTYLKQKDTWFSTRSNELLTFTQHLSFVIYNFEYPVIKTWSDYINNQKRLAFYLFYQINGYLNNRFCSRRDKALDNVLLLYLCNILNSPEANENEYNEFLKNHSCFARIISLLKNEPYKDERFAAEKVIPENAVAQLSKATDILIKFQRISGISLPANSKNIIRNIVFEKSTHKAAQCYEYFLKENSFYESKEIIEKKLFNTNSNQRTSQNISIFLAAYFSLTLKEIKRSTAVDNEPQKIFWSIFYNYSSAVPLDQREHFTHGGLDDIIIIFHIYLYLTFNESKLIKDYIFSAKNLHFNDCLMLQRQCFPDIPLPMIQQKIIQDFSTASKVKQSFSTDSGLDSSNDSSSNRSSGRSTPSFVEDSTNTDRRMIDERVSYFLNHCIR